MGIWDTIKGLGTTIADTGKYLVSEFITNKDMSKGILDFDKYQEYQKMLAAPGLEDADAIDISKKMVNEKIIDPWLYDNATKKAAEQQAKQAMSITDQKTGQYVSDFRNAMTTDITDNYKKGDKYQRDIITKAVDELTSQYQMLADNVNKTLEDTKSPELQKQWDELRPEYETLIRDSAKKYAQYINEGLNFNQAYDKLIKEGKDNANRIVQIQNKLSNAMFWNAGVKGNIKEASKHFSGEGNRTGALGLRDEITNLPKGIFDLGKAVMDVVGGGLQLLGQGIEEGKQALGQYDVLEELDNMNIYRDSGPVIDKRRTLKSRGYEIIDGLPTIAPSIIGFIAGNKLGAALKLDEAMTALIGGGKLLEGAVSVSKAGKFISESMQDLLLMDMVAQPMIGRPITTQDFKDNWMFNIPINAGLASIVRSSRLISALPEGALTPKFVSPNVLKLITDGVKSDDDIVKYMFAEKKAINNSVTSDIVNGMEAIEGLAPSSKIKLNSVTDGMKDTININELPQNIQDKVNTILQGLAKHNNDIKLGKITLTDSLLNQTLDKTIATKGGTLGIKSGTDISIPDEAFKRVDDLKEGIEKKTPQWLVRTKLQQSGLVNLYKSGFISKEELKPIISSTKEGAGKDMLNALWNGDKEAQKRILASMNSVTDSKEFITSMEETYGDVIGKVISLGEKKGALKVGLQIGNYRFIGNGKRWDILTGQELTKQELLQPVSYIKNKDIIINTTKIGRSDYFNYSIPTLLENALKNPFGNTINVSGVFKLYDSPEIIRKLDTYSGIKTWLGNQFKVLNIKYETGTASTMLNSLTSTDANGAYLLSIANELQAKGFNISELSKKELALYKLIHIKEYVDAMTTSELKSGDFKAWFEKLYKEGEGGILKLDTEKYNITNKDSRELALRSADHDFAGIEIKSSQIITKEQLKKASSLDKAGKEFTIDTPFNDKDVVNQIEGYLSDLKYTPIYYTMKDAMLGAVAHIQLAGKEKELFLEGYAQAIGGLLGDRASRKYLTALFAGSSEQFKIQIIQSFIARSFSKNGELRAGLLRNMIDKLSVVSKTENALQYKGIAEMIESFRLMDKHFLYVSPQLKSGFVFQFDKMIQNEIKKSFNITNANKFRFNRIRYNKLAVAKQIKEDGFVDVMTLTDKEIRDISNIVTYNSLGKYGILNESAVETMSNGTYNMIKDFKIKAEKYLDVVGAEDINPKAKVGFEKPLSIERGEDFITLNIKDYSELQVLGMLSQKDKRFKHLNLHEMAHVEQQLGGKKIFNMYQEILNKLKDQYKGIYDRTDKSFFGNDYYKGISSYFTEFKDDRLVTVGEQEKIALVLSKIDAAIQSKTFILEDFQKELEGLYKIFTGVDTKSLYNIKEVLAESIAQMDTYYKIGLSKEEYDSIGLLINNAQRILDDIGVIFNDIGKKYTPTQIQDVLGFKPPILEDAITGEAISKTPVIYNDALSNVANTGFLGEHFLKQAEGKIYDDAIVKWTDIFDKAHQVYRDKNVPKTISINGLERVLRKSIGGYSVSLTNALKNLLGKDSLIFDIRDLFIKESDIKEYETIYKSQYKHIDEYILNKIVANILGTKAEYDRAAMDYLNKSIYTDKLNLEIANLRKNESVFTKSFLAALKATGEDVDGLTLFNIKKMVGGDKKYGDLMKSVNNYMVSLYHTGETSTKVLEDEVWGLKQQLKPLINEMFIKDTNTIKDMAGNILTDSGKLSPDEYFNMYIVDETSTIVDDIVTYMWNNIVADSEIFKYNIDLINKVDKALGTGKGFELNGLMLLEGLFEKKIITSADISRLGKGNGHFEKMFKKYGFDRNNINDVYSYIKRKSLKEARDNNIVREPIDIVFTNGEGFKQVITLEPGADKSSQLLKAFLDFINTEGDIKRILLKSDEIGVNEIVKGDTQTQLMKFLQGPVGSYILDEVGILKTTEPVIPEQVIKKYNPNLMKKIERAIETRKSLNLAPYTEREIKEMIYRVSGDDKYIEIPLTRTKTPVEIFDELKDYYGKPVEYKNGFEFLSKKQKDNKYIFGKLSNMLKVGEYDINTYIEGVMDSKISIAGKDVTDTYKILGMRIPFVTIDKEGEVIISGVSNGFISNSKQIAGEQSKYISNIYNSVEDVSEEGWKLVESGNTTTKLDFDNDSFQVMFDKGGEIKYGTIQKIANGEYKIIEDSIVDKVTKLDEVPEKIKSIRPSIPSDEIQKWVPNYKQTIDNVADDFKC